MEKPKAATPEKGDAEASPWQIILFLKSHWKEITGVLSAVITVGGGLLGWAMLYFATARQVTRLDCTMSASIIVHSKPTEIDLIKTLLSARRLEASRLQRQLGERFEEYLSEQVHRLTAEIDDLQDRMKRAKDAYEAATEKQLSCDKDVTSAGANKLA